MRTAIYARYSSDNQRDASIEDQVRVCSERIKREKWNLAATYSDRAVSGASTLRPGYQKLLQDVRAGHVDIVIAEALDRVSRDQEHIAAFFKQLMFAGVRLFTLAEGEISELHVGLKGTMNALFLKDLADKTRRGLRGRVEEGRSGGGLCYGYDVIKEFDGRGEAIRGQRKINEPEANVVREIFRAFVGGASPQSIAKGLNRRGIKGPNGKEWGPSTIYGNWRRGTGILNNELYIGRLIWNRLKYSKDPSTGKRVSKPNDPDSWIIKNCDELRIIDDQLWEQAKKQQKGIRGEVGEGSSRVRAERARRPVYLFSGLLRCGSCGGGFTMGNTTHYVCNRAHNKGTCDNTHSYRRDKLETAIFDGLKSRLMEPALVKEFVEEYHRELGRMARDMESQRHQQERELARVERDIRAIIESVKAGFRTEAMRDEMEAMEAKKRELNQTLAAPPASNVRLHPNLADIYRARVEGLRSALNEPDTRDEAASILRGLIDEVRLVPEDGQLRIHLVGQLAALFALAQGKQASAQKYLRPNPLSEIGPQVTLVAGAGFIHGSYPYAVDLP